MTEKHISTVHISIEQYPLNPNLLMNRILNASKILAHEASEQRTDVWPWDRTTHPCFGKRVFGRVPQRGWER